MEGRNKWDSTYLTPANLNQVHMILLPFMDTIVITIHTEHSARDRICHNNESQMQARRLSSTSWISSRSLSAGAGLIGSISSEYLLQRTSEDLVACGVDERIQARVDETDHRE